MIEANPLADLTLEKVASQPQTTSLDAETAVLGSILLNTSVLPRVEVVLGYDDFSKEQHKILFRTMQVMAQHGIEIDVIPIKDELKKLGLLEKIGGVSFISSLTDSVPDIANVERYARIVKEHSVNRYITKYFATALQQVGKVPAAQLISQTSENLYDLIAHDGDEAAPTTVDKLVTGVVQEIRDRQAAGDYLTGITTGMPSLDAYLLGWQRGVLNVIGAYTSHGKTASGLDFAIKALEAEGNEDLHVLYIALEMTKQMLAFRLLANASGEDLHRVRTGHLSEQGNERIQFGHKRLSTIGRRFHITDGAFEIAQIRAIARGLAQQGRLGLIFVDYLQLVSGDAGENREREVNMVGLNLLRLAKQLNVPVIAFAQLNEGAVNRDDHEPRIYDMRESRAINQHARTVMLLNRPWMFDKPQDDPTLKPCLTYIHIEKNSESKAGKIQLHFNGAFQRFEEGCCYEGCEYWRPGIDDRAQEERNWN